MIRQNYGDNKRSVVTRGWERRRISRIQRTFRAVKINLYDPMVIDVIIHLFKPTECTKAIESHNINYELWVILRCYAGSSTVVKKKKNYHSGK